MREFRQLKSKEYGDVMSHRTSEINASYDRLVELLGEPFKQTEPGYPDDGYKTDVCWGIVDTNGKNILIWNYKNGPAYNGSGTVEYIDEFSVFHEDDAFLEELKSSI